jgi:hypothetical protein
MPTEELEDALRRVLARAAADIPDPEQARQRLLQRTCRPGRGRRRLAAGITAAAAAAALVLGLGLSGAFGPAPGRGTGTIRAAAFTLVEHANGTATVTINPNLLLDPGVLQNALRHDGIPAIVTAGSFCSSDPIPAGLAQVLPGSTGTPLMPPSFTINPAAMPAGTELSFGTLHSASRIQTVIELIDTNSHTCSTLPEPFPPPYGKGVVVVYEGHLAGPNIVVSGSPGEPAGS